LNKYVWLVETIYKAKKISYEEINRRWLDNDMSEGKPLPLRCFWRSVRNDSLYLSGTLRTFLKFPRNAFIYGTNCVNHPKLLPFVSIIS
jgi:hypothetical protein